MTNKKIDEVIAELLTEGQKIVRAGESWSPPVVLVRGDKKLLFAFPSFGQSSTEKDNPSTFIDALIEEHQAEVAILIKHVWTAALKEQELPAFGGDGPDRGQALAIFLWGPAQPLRIGIQPYRRQPDGAVNFEGFKWGVRSFRVDGTQMTCGTAVQMAIPTHPDRAVEDAEA